MTRTFRPLAAAVAALVLVAGVTFAASSPADAKVKEPERHCIARTTKAVAEAAAPAATPTQCWDSRAEANAALVARGVLPEGAGDGRAELVARDAHNMAARANGQDVILAVHYADDAFEGSSLTVYGTFCDGGYLNTDSYWSTRISATWQDCDVVGHWTLPNLWGAVEDTFKPGAILGSPLNDNVKSIEYLPYW